MLEGKINNQPSSYNFFLVIIPGLESLGCLEIKHKAKIHNIELQALKEVPGGVEFSVTDINQGFVFNQILKIPTRILLIIDTFVARDIPKLFKKFLKINWNLYIPAQIPKIKITAKKSKLFDSRKIEKCLLDALKKYTIANEPSKKAKEMNWPVPPEIFVKFTNNQCTLTFNTTGERLDKRGDKLFTTQAPLRQSIAAAMFFACKNELDFSAVYDPMCGSGTFSVEALNFFSITNREFSFECCPLYKSLPKLNEESECIKVVANDKDSEALKALKENFKEQDITLLANDLFDNKETFTESLAFINPPYNKRIKTSKDPGLYHQEVIEHLLKTNKVIAVCSIYPFSFKRIKSQVIKEQEVTTIKNGGIDVRISLFKLKK